MMFDWINKLRGMAKAAPLPDGPMVGANLQEGLHAETVVLLSVDSNGQVHQLHNMELRNGTFAYINNPRTEIIKLLDTLGVVDHGSWNVLD